MSFDFQKYPILSLAFLGDAVYELQIRERVARGSVLTAADMHRETVKRVCAAFQSDAVQRILPFLTAEELALYKRGRNAHPGSTPKNADILAYRRATGLECLVGYLYLNGEKERLDQLFDSIYMEC